jgi:hypothetical protein
LLEIGVPTITLFPRISAQTPSFNVSLGHFSDVGGDVEGVGGGGGQAIGDGGGGLGFGFGGGGKALGEGGGGLGLGFGVGDGLHVPQACENVE